MRSSTTATTTISAAILAAVLSFDPSTTVALAKEASSSNPEAVNAYESRMKLAMEYYASKSEELIKSAFNEGVAKMNAEGNNESLSLDVDTELLYADFAARAVTDEIARTRVLGRMVREAPSIYDFYEDEFEDDDQVDVEFDWDYADDVEVEAEIKRNLDPEKWFRFDYWELHAYFSCAASFTKKRPPYDAEKWRDLRDFYHVFVAQDKVDRPLREGEKERSFVFTEGEFDPPMEPFFTEWKGRGLRAVSDIPKGALVFKATNNTVIFTHGHTWRKWLFANYERSEELDTETACDLLVWSWVQQLVEGGPVVIVLDLDNGSLMNEGRHEKGWEPPNIRCGKEGERCEMAYYATSDIKAGEEILCDYREFALLNEWKTMGL